MSACSRPVEKPRNIDLPPPRRDRSSELFNAFDMRRTIRDIGCARPPLETVSDLLWYACGINRWPGPFGTAGRTAASASNSQEIQLYVAMPEGAYQYNPGTHSLAAVCTEDLRYLALTPGQKGVAAVAPLQLIYVVDLRKLTNTSGFDEPGLHDPETQRSYYFVDTGLIAGNVYLFAAAKGLAAWFHNCDREQLARRLRLGSDEKVLFAQSVGYPAVP